MYDMVIFALLAVQIITTNLNLSVNIEFEYSNII